MRGRRRAWDLRTSSCPLDFFSALFVFQTKNGNRIKVVVNPCNWSFPGEKPFSGLLKNSSEIWNVTEKLGEPLSLFVHSQTLPTVFSCYNLLGLIVIEMSIFVRNACRTNSSPRFWSFH